MQKLQLVTSYADQGSPVIKQSFGKEFDSHKGNSCMVTYSSSLAKKGEFTRLEAKHDFSPCWVELEISELSVTRDNKSRLTSKSITLDRDNLEQFALNLLEIAKGLTLRGDRKVQRADSVTVKQAADILDK